MDNHAKAKALLLVLVIMCVVHGMQVRNNNNDSSNSNHNHNHNHNSNNNNDNDNARQMSPPAAVPTATEQPSPTEPQVTVEEDQYQLEEEVFDPIEAAKQFGEDALQAVVDTRDMLDPDSKVIQNNVSVGRPVCRHMNEIYPGKLVADPVWHRWVPDNCDLEILNRRAMNRCFKHLRLYMVTDSLGREMLTHLGLAYRIFNRLPEGGDLRVMDHAWSPFTSKPFGYLNQNLSRDSGEFLREKANFLFISNGFWDAGHFFCGPVHYYDYLLLKVKRYSSEMAADGSRAVLYNIPYISDKKPCYPERKLAVFREAIRLVAACTGVGIYDTFEMQKTNMKYATDGIHFRGKGLATNLGVLLNMMCLPEGTRLEPFHPNITCSPEVISATKARWEADEVAMTHSPECPKLRNTCYKSPEEYLNMQPKKAVS